MNKIIGTALTLTALLAQMQSQVCAQSADQLQTQMPQLQPAMPTLDTNLRGPVSSQTTVQSTSAAPFSTASSYSYRDPAPTNGGYESQPSYATPSYATPPQPMGNPTGAAFPQTRPAKQSRKPKQSKHGFSPVGAVLGVPDRAVKTSLGLTDRTTKTSLGLTDRTAKTSLGIPAKATKEVFKALF